MTRWKPNLAPVEEASEPKPDEARLVKLDKSAEPASEWQTPSDVSVAEESPEQKRSCDAPQNTVQTAPKTSSPHNPLDDASIDDLGSFLKLPSDEQSKEGETPVKEVQPQAAGALARIKPYMKYGLAALLCVALAGAAYTVYRLYFNESQVSATVYILNNNQPVHEEALKMTDPASMTNFVQRFFVARLLERGFSSTSDSKFTSASAMLDWFRKSLKIDRDVSEHAARISFNLTGSDPMLMSKLVDGYISSYIESKAAIDAQTPIMESSVTANTQPSVNNGAKSAPVTSPESEAISNNLKIVDEKLRKLDEVDQEYVSAQKLLSRDRLIGSSDANVFRGFMPESDLATNSALAKLQSRVVELAVQKNALQVKFAPSSREIQAIEQEIRGIREAMRQYLTEQRQFVQARRGELLAERAEVLRKKALVSIENDITAPSPVQQSAQAMPMNRRPVQGNLPSGRFWYVGQDGMTIIAEPTTLGKTIAATTAGGSTGQYRFEAPPQNPGYAPGPINHLNSNAALSQPGSYPNMNQTPNNYMERPIYPAQNYGPPINPVNQFQQAPQQYNAPQNPAQNMGAPAAHRPADYGQQFRYNDAYSTAQPQGASPVTTQQSAPQTQFQPPMSHYPNPLHTGVGQSPLMSNGLGSKFHQPNSPVNRSQTQTLRGSY